MGINLMILVLVFIIIVVADLLWLSYYLKKKRYEITLESERIIDDAKIKADTIIKKAEVEGKEKLLQEKSRWEKEMMKRSKEIERFNKKLSEREAILERRSQHLTEREGALIRNEKYLANLENILKIKMERYDQLIEDEIKKLEKISFLTKDEAKDMLFDNIKKQAEIDAVRIRKGIIDKAKEDAEKEARLIIAQAIQKIDIETITETTVSVVELPNDELKGRVIGREGRNIRTFEMLTGVEVLVDDTPGALILSSFDPIRRKKAEMAMKRLLSDGRIHPARIEEIFDDVNKEFMKIVHEIGEEVVSELGIIDINPELYTYIGKMKYRTSYGQNLLQHSKEVAYIAGVMASELGLDVHIAKRAGLLHDIGKIADLSKEGSHALIGAEICKNYGEIEEVVNAIASHHEEVAPITAYAFIVAASDSISGARPGARRESLEKYLKRIARIEEIANSQEGVSKTFAIQAGRELRVLVQSSAISDIETSELAEKIASDIEKEIKFPGYIKVTVIREVRAVAYAR